ncbi:glycosyltransferase family 2 protein (plasmid) [Salipiger sp. H15]|uniref:Glycosyltransferase family 2 protein n=1 Tax=Alloyangia sp. H15 TaxID=3029062 RepID=A0AAU8AP89_9RHOB
MTRLIEIHSPSGDVSLRPRPAPETVLLVIPTLNEEAHIEHTLDQLLRGRYGAERVETVVADGGSTDRTRALVTAYAERNPNVRLIDNPRRLQSAAVNLAVSSCARPEHRVLVRCDAHAIYPPGYVLSVANSLMGREADALATVMDAVGETCFERALAAIVDTPLGSGGSGHRGGTRSGYVDHGHHAGFRLDMWRKVGGYNESFAANEDAELDHRISLAGGRIWLDAGIRMKYKVRPSPARLARQYWLYGRGRAQTVTTHGLRPRLRQRIPVIALVVNILSLLGGALLHPALFLPLAVYLLTLCAASAYLVLRMRSACGLWGGVALFAMQMFWGAGYLRQRLAGPGAR